MKKRYAIIGNWDFPKNDTSEGITVAQYDPQQGTFQKGETFFQEVNCGAIFVDRKRDVLYCVNEKQEITGVHPGGQIVALKIDRETGTLIELNRKPSYGPLPSYCALDLSGDYLIVSNHSGRSSITKTVQDPDGTYHLVREYDETAIVLFSLDRDGRIGEPCDIVRHFGHGMLPGQTNPHAHSVNRAPGMDLFAVCDKGDDSLYMYGIDHSNKKLVQLDRMAGGPGSSLRYSVLHPTLPYCILIMKPWALSIWFNMMSLAN